MVTATADRYWVGKEAVMRKTIVKYCRGCVLAFLIISLSISPLAIGAEQEILKTARQRLRTKITYSCTELPIENVLMDLAEQAKLILSKAPRLPVMLQ